MKKNKNQDIIINVKIHQVIGILYLPSFPTNSAIIYAKGGPSFADTGDSPLWPTAKKYNYALFIPDYIGYCRSYGNFNFKNCLQTIYESEDFLRGKLVATQVDTQKKIKLKFQNIVLVGSSWGGAIVPFLEKYKHSQIKHICLLKSVLDWNTQGKTEFPEEDVLQTDILIENGWENIYRGYKDSEWPEIFAGHLSEYNPLDHPELLKGKYVYICHGDKDQSINWRKSYQFYQKLQQDKSRNGVFWKLFKNEGHNDQINIKGLDFSLRKIKQHSFFP
ncbi:MAG: prolyl oligopeptidase family serine peptidase [Patescibacteria group bacterium]|nr:prolyl oligopeptidase family serine peptidase [Patescibacteria group bacterium]